MATKEQVDDFLNDLDDYVSVVAFDTSASSDSNDSCFGMGSWDARRKMEKSLYKLFDIEVEEEQD